MKDKQFLSKFERLTIVSAATIVVLAGLKLAAELIVPFLLAAFIALLCSAPLFWLNRKKVPNAVSVVIVVLGLLGLGTIIGVTAGASINSLTRSLPTYHEVLQMQFNGLLLTMEKFGLDVSEYKESITSIFDPSSAIGLVAGALKKSGGILANGFMIILTIVFILLEAVGMPKKLERTVNDPEKTFDGFRTFFQSVKRYLVIKTFISAITGIAAGICMWIIGVDFPILWGLTAFGFNFVPTIGSFIAAIPPLLLGTVQFGIGAIVPIGACYLVINVIMGNIIEPKLTGEKLGLSPLVVLISLVFWGWLLGPVGMLLSVPLTMIVKIACESQENTKHIGIILGP